MTGKEITRREAHLPAEVRDEVRLLRESPERYYATLKEERAEDDRKDGALTMYHLNKGMERAEALLAISIAILEVKDWFNVKGNLTDRQVKLLAEMILDNPAFYDLSVGNIKACFRERMMNEKVYDRLDGNIIMGWLKRFKAEMGDACYRQRVEADREERLKEEGEWRGLEGKIDSEGNLAEENAPKRTLNLTAHLPDAPRYLSREEREQKRREFLKYKAEYILRKRNEGKDL